MSLRARKALAWSGVAFGALLAIVASAIAWVLFTTSGARWVASTVTSRFAPQVEYASLEGTIAGELVVTDFSFSGAPDTAQIRIAHLSIDPTLSMLFSRVLRIDRARVRGLLVTLPPAKDDPETDEPLWIEPPLDVVVNDFELIDGTVRRGNEPLLRVKQLGASARWTARELVIERLTLLPGDFPGDLAVSGRVTPQANTVRAELTARWKDVVIPAELAGRSLATRGEIQVVGTPEEYAATGEFDIGPPGEPTHVTLRMNGTDTRAVLERLTLEQRAGRLALQGTVDFKPAIGWDLSAQATDFNPGELLAEWPGSIDLDLASQGRMTDEGPSGTLRIASLSGELRGRPISGGGDLELVAPSRVTGDLHVASGKSRITVKGNSAAGNQIDATVNLDVASLNDWVPDTEGSLTGQFRVRGVWPKLNVAGSADGKSLALADHRVAKLHVEATVEQPLDPEGEISITAETIEVAGFVFARATIQGSGNQARHRVQLDADGEKLDAGVSVEGGLVEGGWRGRLARLALDAPDIAQLALRAPVDFEFVNGAVRVSQLCLADGDTVLCGEAAMQPGGALQASYSFEKVPLGLANAIAPDAMPGQLRGEVAGQGKVRRTADGQWFGDVNIDSRSASLVLHDDSEGASVLGERTLLLYENLDLTAQLEGATAKANLTATLMNGGSVRATLGATNIMAEAPGISGRIEAAMPTLAPFAAFVPAASNLDGAVNAQIEIAGTVAAPEVTGNIDATRLQADLGLLGIELREGRLRGEARRGGGFLLTGSVSSGKGALEFDGTMNERGVVDVKIEGRDFLAADIPAAKVIITPALALTGDPKGYHLRGEVTIPSADINLQKLPRDQPPGVSPDVVVIRNGKEVKRDAPGSALPLEATVLVKLGDAIAITGYGLEAAVTGQLTVREAPGVPTTGSGQLAVSGTYQAYGQDLTIREGRLLFAGTPLDNPRLSIVAMRDIDDNLQTGLRIAGSAQRPVITVISDPEVGEADALSYLVTGRSLSDVGSASGSSQDALASATRSLEGAGAGLVAKRIGARLGLDEAGVEENEMIGGSALTVGEYLSPRLYLSYGVGLFEPGEVIALRYKLSSDMSVRIQRGTEETRAGVEYRVEK